MYTPPRYTVPPTAYEQPYSYGSPMASSTPGGYYTQHYPTYMSSTLPRSYSKGHGRRASHDTAGHGYSSSRTARYATPEPAGSGGYYSSSPPRNADYVSSSERVRSRYPSFWVPSRGYEDDAWRRSYQPAYDSSDEDLAQYFAYTAPRESDSRQRYSYRRADQYRVYEEQVPVYADAEPTVRRSRARRSSHSARPTTSPKATKPPKSSPKPTTKPPPVATEEDRKRARIPSGYSLKNWDPTEMPVLLLGSVFDANSLGKWIYDWTVFHHGAATPMSEIAGELWLLLIQLAGKVKRAEEGLRRVRKKADQEMIEDFLESGERLWDRFRRLLKTCEEFMWRAARREKGSGHGVSMGKSSGCEFVDSIFGRDRELEKTEKLMTGMRLWSMRFDANCEDILRRPTA
ncbi:MAG: hypothetical protein M1838_006204 [Thelocarpon superellum]|nr:MAG: hypothetical protein M1838_006204 [Thelocarpon superellum]